jgi:hypothetical protein
MNTFIAEVPAERQHQGIRWLILREDSQETGGWYLFAHSTLERACDFDSWHLTRGDAEREAAMCWGVLERNWLRCDR